MGSMMLDNAFSLFSRANDGFLRRNSRVRSEIDFLLEGDRSGIGGLDGPDICAMIWAGVLKGT